MATLDPRYRPLLERCADVAGPFLDSIDAPDPAWPGSNEAAARPIAAAVPDTAVDALSVVVLRRIVESDRQTGMSLPGAVRAALARRSTPPDPECLALELAMCAVGVDLGPGIGLARLRLALYDPVIARLERLAPAAATPGLIEEVETAAGLLASTDLDATTEAAETVDRRQPLIAFLLRLEPGSLTPLAFDDGDEYGATMRTLIETDARLAADLATCYALLAGGGGVLPPARWSAAATAAIDEHPSPTLGSSLVRSLRPLLDLDPPPTAGLPGMARVIRPTNQRLIRGLLWLAARVDPAWAAGAFAEIGIRLGTSGRHDNTALDGAVASTAAAMLGEIGSPEAAAGLARMQARITNRPVGKQIAAALERLATDPAGPGDAALPDFGLAADGRRSIAVGDWTALLEVAPDGTVGALWQGPGGPAGPVSARPPATIRDERPGEVEAIAELVKRIRATIAEERRRVEHDFASGRARPLDAWQARWLDDPIGRVFGRRLVWQFEGPAGAVVGLPLGAAIEDASGRPIRPLAGSIVRLWHPVEAAAAAVEAWRVRVVALRLVQPVKQVFRETYGPGPGAADALLERRFAGRALDQGRLRALMRDRRWAGSILGPWDQGEGGSVGHDVEGTEWRAELGLEAVGRADHQEAVRIVRSGSVRFLRGRGRAARPATIDTVPPRIRSEVLRDVDLFTAVADITRPSPRDAAGRDDDASSAIVASRAAILRAVIPTLPVASRLTVFGRWLRVEGPPDCAISLVDGRALSLADESEIAAPPAAGSAAIAPPYLPTSDDPTLDTILALALRYAEGPN